MEPVKEDAVKVRPHWGRIAVFYAIAFGWVSIIAAGLYLLGDRNLSSTEGTGMAAIAVAILALLYMPAPMVAALIIEKRAGKGYLMGRTFGKGFWTSFKRILIVAPAVLLTLLLGMTVFSYLAGNALGINGAGTLLFNSDDLVANTLALAGTSMDSDQVAALTARTPGLAGTLGLAFAGALIAGFTVNGLFALGEEYGWRGWLADQLRPLGAVWANLIIGVLWGLWHAPLILMGFNYGSYRVLGVGFMMAWCIAASFLLWRARQVTGSVLAAAVIHGGINGFAGVFLLVLVNTNALVAAPMGLIGIATVALVAVLFWLVTARVKPVPVATSEPAVAPAVEDPATT